MRLRNLFLASCLAMMAAVNVTAANEDYKQDSTYIRLRAAMTASFNEADSARFFVAVKKLEDYLLQQDDLHAYYTQRCNEIVFLMNRQQIFEAYKLARQLSHELRERRLDKEMYMAINMMGHIYRYCGNKESARRCFEEVIERMEQAGYRESMPPIYMNIVNVLMDEDPEEALRMLERAAAISAETSPERVFDIETRRTVAYYELGDTARFLEGYRAYKEGEAQGRTSVHGRQIEVDYLAITGQTDEALAMAREELGDDSYGTQASILRGAGRWQEAYEALREEGKASDSINSVILSNSMQGIQDELRLYDAERRAQENRFLAISAIAALLGLLVVALVYIVVTRRRHMRQLNSAYQHALESDNMKAAFIQNVSHEVRTPLNIISGFAQVMADPTMDATQGEREEMAQMIQKNTGIITNLIDEMLELSLNESTGSVTTDDNVAVNALLRELIASEEENLTAGVSMQLQTDLADDFTVRTNRTMLHRIMDSLVNNAIKYTEEGHILVSATSSDGQLMLAVEDTGCGIPAEDAERIFERFVKLDSFKVGIGLGLPLSRSLAQRLGGSVVLDTSYESGARFIVTLPIA